MSLYRYIQPLIRKFIEQCLREMAIRFLRVITNSTKKNSTELSTLVANAGLNESVMSYLDFCGKSLGYRLHVFPIILCWDFKSIKQWHEWVTWIRSLYCEKSVFLFLSNHDFQRYGKHWNFYQTQTLFKNVKPRDLPQKSNEDIRFSFCASFSIFQWNFSVQYF